MRKHQLFLHFLPPLYMLPILTFQYWAMGVGALRSVGKQGGKHNSGDGGKEAESPREEIGECVTCELVAT